MSITHDRIAVLAVAEHRLWQATFDAADDTDHQARTVAHREARRRLHDAIDASGDKVLTAADLARFPTIMP